VLGGSLILLITAGFECIKKFQIKEHLVPRYFLEKKLKIKSNQRTIGFLLC
jgi:hypothetical protein